MRTAVAVVILIAMAAALGGCGGGSSSGTAAKARIQEFVGAGYSGEKPGGCEFTPATGAAGAKTLPALLGLNAAPAAGTVPVRQVSWYRLAAYPTDRKVVITLQQLAPEDSDLFVLSSAPYLSGANLLGSSTRSASGGDGDVCDAGVPDWLFLSLPAPNDNPAAQIAVYGVNNDPALKHYQLAIDTVTTLAVDAVAAVHGSVPEFDSRWYRFRPTVGQTYDVYAALASGSDPDLFVYRGSATGFVGADTTAGTAHVRFTATNDTWHYVRLYGYGGATENHYDLRVATAVD